MYRAALLFRVLVACRSSKFRGSRLTCCSDFEFWNFTYAMPEGSEKTPRAVLHFTVA